MKKLCTSRAKTKGIFGFVQRSPLSWKYVLDIMFEKDEQYLLNAFATGDGATKEVVDALETFDKQCEFSKSNDAVLSCFDFAKKLRNDQDSGVKSMLFDGNACTLKIECQDRWV